MSSQDGPERVWVMHLLFFRHGEAEELGVAGTDAKRRLTPQGEAENRLALEAIQRAGVRLDVIVHSPLVRAAQTAEAAGTALGPPDGVHADDRLRGGAGLEEVQGIVRDYPAKALMLIGHNPDLSTIVGDLLGEARIALKTSGVACVELPVVEPGAGELQWLIHAKLLG